MKFIYTTFFLTVFFLNVARGQREKERFDFDWKFSLGDAAKPRIQNSMTAIGRRFNCHMTGALNSPCQRSIPVRVGWQVRWDICRWNWVVSQEFTVPKAYEEKKLLFNLTVYVIATYLVMRNIMPGRFWDAKYFSSEDAKVQLCGYKYYNLFYEDRTTIGPFVFGL